MTKLKLKVKLYGGDVRLRRTLRGPNFISRNVRGTSGRYKEYKLKLNDIPYQDDTLIRYTTNLTTAQRALYDVTIVREPHPTVPNRFNEIRMKIKASTFNTTCKTCWRKVGLTARLNGNHLVAPHPGDPGPRTWPIDRRSQTFIIYVEVDPTFHPDTLIMIGELLHEIEGISGIRFRYYDAGDRMIPNVSRIKFEPGGQFCQTSHVGFDPLRHSTISLGQGCRNRRVIRHELGHSLGRIHEFCRFDRNGSIRINWGNIKHDWWEQFEIERGLHGHLGYDENSTMSYDVTGESSIEVNGVKLPTYARLDGTTANLGPLLEGAYTNLDLGWYPHYYPAPP